MNGTSHFATRLRRRRRALAHRSCTSNVIFSALCLFTLYTCLLCMSVQVDRLFPRAVRELRRNSVNWRSRLLIAKTRPKFTLLIEPFIYVISLRNTPSRRASLIWSLERAEMTFEVFYGVDGSQNIDHQDIYTYASASRISKLAATSLIGRQAIISTAGKPALHERLRFGCLLSHVHIWEDLRRTRRQYVVVLEDDVNISEGFKLKLEMSLQELPDNWDIFYLDSCHTKLGGILQPGVFQLRGALCTHGYAISWQGAEKLLTRTRQSEKPIDHIIDEAIYRTELFAFHSFPPLISLRVLESTLAYPSA